MPNSERYDRLVEDLSVARKISYNVDPLVCRTVLQDLKIKSYIFLTHAAIESYIEDIALETATSAIMLLKKENVICRALIGLISSGLLFRMEEKSLSRKISEDLFANIGEFANVAYGRFKSVVSSNNGITTVDQKKLFLPIGIDPEVEDSALMSALNGFGGKRGAIAHDFKISKAHTLSEIDGDVNTIKLGLIGYDAACASALATKMDAI